MHTIYKVLPIESLQRGHYQPREAFDENALQDLAQSIRTQGLIEPLVVREISAHHYEIIAGERRWRAAMMAGFTDIPCLIGNYSNEQAAAVTLIENIQRQDLNLIEEAQGYQRLLTEFHFSQQDVATLVGKSRSHIANILRLLDLCETVQQQVRAKQLSLGHARMLVGLTIAQQKKLTQHIQKHQWSVRRLEKEVKQCKQPNLSANAPLKNNDLLYLEAALAEHIGTPVQIEGQGEQGGWLKIKFFNHDTLAGLLERLGLSYD